MEDLSDGERESLYTKTADKSSKEQQAQLPRNSSDEPTMAADDTRPLENPEEAQPGNLPCEFFTTQFLQCKFCRTNLTLLESSGL